MSQPTTSSRPRQVTLAAWLIMIGSAFVVLMVFDRVADLHSIETRESVERFLAEPPGSDLGVGVEGVITLIRTFSMVAAGCATAAAILGYQVLRRSRSARLALTILAVPLFLTGMVTGGFVSSVVAASAAMLWLQPARDWFRETPSRSSTSAPEARDGAAPSPQSFRDGASTGGGPAVPPTPPARSTQPVPPVARPREPHVSRTRPMGVVWACVLTWVLSGLTALAMIASVVVIAASPDLVFDEVQRQNPDLAQQGVSEDMLLVATYVMGAFVVGWCVSAVLVAVLTFRRVAWARIVLIVSASVCAAVCVVGSAFGAFLLVFPLAASVATIALLARPEVRSWFERQAV